MSELPADWALVAFSEVAELVRGVSYKKNEADINPREGLIPILRANNIQNGNLVLHDLVYVPTDKVKEKQLIKQGDIIVAMSSGSKKLVGKSGVCDKRITASFGTFCGLIRAKSNCYPRYLGWFTQSKYYTDTISNLSKGVNINNLKPAHFEELQIPLPTLTEQKRIADKLDSVLAKVEAAQARLDKIPAILKRFRQSVLAAATSGELTKDWRQKNLLTRIERIEGIFELNFDVIEKSNIPANWQYEALGNFAKCSRGKFSVRPRNDPSCFDGKYPFIQIGDLPKEGGAIVNHKQTLNEKGFSVSREFKTGTVVIAIVGATIANTGITTYPVCFPDSLIGINSPSDIENVYIDYVLRAFKEDIKRVSYAGGGQPNIKLTTINPLPIPLPPKTEIEEIVTRVEALFEHSNTVEKQYYVAKARLDKLTQSILKKAFEGELFNDSVHLENSITDQVNKLEAV
jgi:type I restriction enzyme S subunit